MTDSKVPRDTKKLVAGVGELKNQVCAYFSVTLAMSYLLPGYQQPELVERLLKEIQAISDEAKRCLADPELSREQLLAGLSVSPTLPLPLPPVLNFAPQALIEENHAHLVTLGVSHASLEAIKAKTKTAPFNLSTKLTGAGGGGCAVTLVPDGACKYCLTHHSAHCLGFFCFFVQTSRTRPCRSSNRHWRMTASTLT